jgi:tyrosyl-tRNA synthetase
LGELIVAQYHSQGLAKKARQEFEKVFSQKETPQDLPEYKLKNKENIIAILINSGLVKSGNEARRLLKEGAVFFEGTKVNSIDFLPQQSGTLKVGARRFLKLII